jgi:N-acetylmuramoyl-L-alanine amidase
MERAKTMKKLVAISTLGLSLLIATPAFAYTVKSGDTMSKIARDNNLTLQEVSNVNPQVKNIDLIYVGQNIETKFVEKDQKIDASATLSEKDLMARLVSAESLSEPYAGKVAVAIVVLNRVDSDEFPNSITTVIDQPGQFTPVSNGAINKPADSDSIKAVEEALAYDRSQGFGSLFFYNPLTATNNWLDNRPTTTTIGNHIFKK